MGGIVSRSQVVLPAEQHIEIPVGFLSTKTKRVQIDLTSEQSTTNEKSLSAVKWKILPTGDEARKRFEADGTLKKVSDPDRLELRMMLDDPIAQRALAKFAKEHVQLDILMCWVDTHEFRAIPTQDYRRSKALHIYHKYIKPDAVLEIGGVGPDEKARVALLIGMSKDDPGTLKEDLFEKVQVMEP